MDKKKTEEGKEREIDITSIYTPLSVAKEEIWRRWNDKELKKKVDDFLNGNIPAPFENKPRAVLARHVATPNIEHVAFLRKTSMLDCAPLLLEYLDDTYSPDNSSKYYLGKIFFLKGKGKNGGCNNECKRIINFNENSGKKIVDVNIGNTNEKLISFHHSFIDSNFPNAERFDISDWYSKNGNFADKYYKYLLALFIRNGVLFENFLVNKEEEKFTREVVIPNFIEIEKIFGVKPLIVRLLPQEDESEDYWYWYPSLIKNDFNEFFKKYLNN